jgi:hypothetical protein
VYKVKIMINHLSNIMKKHLVVLMVIATAMATLTFFAFKVADKEKVKGWFLAGSYPEGYDIGVEKNAERHSNVAYLKSIKPIKGDKFGTIMQSFFPEDYLGKRVKLTCYIKTDQVTEWAGLWFRIDGPSKIALGFDNMQDRPIKGTTGWKKYEIVLDVPGNSHAIAYGVLLSGPGTVWLDDMTFEVVRKDVPLTKESVNKPQNTDFEDPNN